MRISDWSSDVCSSDLRRSAGQRNVGERNVQAEIVEGEPLAAVEGPARNFEGQRETAAGAPVDEGIKGLLQPGLELAVVDRRDGVLVLRRLGIVVIDRHPALARALARKGVAAAADQRIIPAILDALQYGDRQSTRLKY